MTDSNNFKLTEKEEQFVKLYRGDPIQAAKDANYKNPVIDSIKLLGRAAIKTAIRQETGKSYKELYSREGRKKYYAKIVTGELTEVVIKDGKPFELPATMGNRIKALDSLARMHGDFNDTVKVEVSLEDELMSMSIEEVQKRIKKLEAAGVIELIEQGQEWIPGFEEEKKDD